MHESRHCWCSLFSLLFIMFNCVFYTDSQRITLSCVPVWMWKYKFWDVYSFCPSGSTSAALIAILHSVTELLSSNPFVVVLALDFSKAFDAIRHAALFRKVALSNIPDPVYNWFVEFLSDQRHCTRQCSRIRILCFFFQISKKTWLFTFFWNDVAYQKVVKSL